MQTPPKSAYEKTGGMAYFPRRLDKIRLEAQGQLGPDFQRNLGIGADGFCTKFLRVAYPELKSRVLAGGTDEEILQWCFALGRTLDENNLMIWNAFITKVGWRKQANALLEKFKAEHGLAHRTGIMTMPEFFEVDEGRKPA